MINCCVFCFCLFLQSPFSDEDFSSDLGFFSSSSNEDEKEEKPDMGNLVFDVVKQEVSGTMVSYNY